MPPIDPPLTADQIITLLELAPLPVEGGYFRRTYYADERIPTTALPPRYPSPRRFGGGIFYLLTDEPDCFSALHRLATDEVYHFYLGDPVELLLLHPDGGTQRVILGSGLLAGQQVQVVVPRGIWQGARLQPGGRWALMGTTMAPAYEPDDYVHGEREVLMAQYPAEADAIRRLTRRPDGGGPA